MPYYSLYDIKRILEILLLFYTGFVLLISNKQRQSILSIYDAIPKNVRLVILLFFMFGLYSAYDAPLQTIALLQVAIYFLLFCFIFLIASIRKNYGDNVDILLLGLIIIGLANYEFCFFYAYVNALLIKTNINLFPGFANIRFLAQVQTWTLPFVCLPILLINKNNRLLRTMFYLLASLWWMIAFSNAAKGMLLGLLLAILLATLIFKKTLIKWLVVQLKTAIIGLILYLVLFVLITQIISGFSSLAPSADARIDLWLIAIQHIIKHPLLGIGPLHFAYYPTLLGAHPHNSFFLIASEWGLPAAIIILTLVIYGIMTWIKYVKSFSQESRPEYILSITIAFFAGLIYSLISGVIVMPISQILCCMIIGWMIGINKTPRGKQRGILPHYISLARSKFALSDQRGELHLSPLETPSPSSPWQATGNSQVKSKKIDITTGQSLLAELFFIFFIILAIVGIVRGIYPAILTLPADEIKWMITHQFKIYFEPRFWLQGFLR